MSALEDPIGGLLDTLVATQRGMTDWEADWFLRTGQLPDLSQPPVDDASLITNIPEITESEARAFLAGQPLVAGAGWGAPSEIKFRFDPNQERGPDGRWIDEGGPSSGVLSDPRAVLAAAPIALVAGRRGMQLQCRPETLAICAEGRARTVTSTLSDYRGSGYHDINGLLRGNRQTHEPEPIVESWISTMDEAMVNSPLDQAVQVQRGLEDATGIFGDAALLDDDLTGFEWTEDAFVSTTSHPDVVDMFSMHGGMVMSIHVPAGIGALKLSEVPDDDHGFDEAELLLQRGLKMRVRADRGRDRNNRRILDVEVVPA